MNPSSARTLLESWLALPPDAAPHLRQAFVHESYLNEQSGSRVESNERLEFLGDAILGALVAEELFRRYPNSQEGELTITRTWMIRGTTLSRWARLLDLGSRVLLGRGEERAAGREREALLTQLFEAVLGAVYMDFGLDAARSLVVPLIEAELTEGAASSRPLDAKSRLQQRAQASLGVTPRYELIEVVGPDHSPTYTFRVIAGPELSAAGTGRTKQSAQQTAAETALMELDRREAAGVRPESPSP